MAGQTLIQVVAFLILVCSVSTVFSSSNSDSTKGLCHDNERLILLKLRAVNDRYTYEYCHRASSNCCKWNGVVCNATTGHVTKLSLNSSPCWSVDLSLNEMDSLQELKYLTHLDLSYANFVLPSIPKSFGSFKKLRYLNLSHASFGGIVPHQLGNLSLLCYLDLSSGEGRLGVDNLQWLSHLSSLKRLEMTNVDLRRATDWLQTINMLPKLSVLSLSNCKLSNFPTLPSLNLTSLTSLDLSRNRFSSKLSNWLGNLHNLVNLDFSDAGLVGQIPHALGFLCNLKKFNVARNNMDGKVDEFFDSLSRCDESNYKKPGVFSTIEALDLSYNNFSGTLPKRMGELSNMIDLKVSHNSLRGVLSEAHFANLKRLESLDMSFNSFRMIMSPDWVPPFQLKNILLGSCEVGPRFPMWLQYQKDWEQLNLFNASISSKMPDWFWNSSSQIVYLNLSQNHISGRISHSLQFPFSASVDFSSNYFDGPLPKYIANATILDLSNNFLSGPIDMFIDAGTQYLSLSNNHLIGNIPSFMCNISQLYVLDLSRNGLTGNIPFCHDNLPWFVLDLSNNHLSGEIPDMFYPRDWFAPSLEWMQLSHNNISGALPSSIMSLSYLVSMDLSHNRLSGTIPKRIGERLSQLKILNLQSNMFDGSIPPQLSRLSSLQILVLADNQFSGNVPSSFGNFTAMKIERNLSDIVTNTSKDYRIYMDVVMKGFELQYTKILTLVTTIDLSRNQLSGEIPQQLTALHMLQNLNLSRNSFVGKIPKDIGKIRQLLSLDLSNNNLSGTIPPSLAELSFMGSLNLSFNHLHGRIPQGNQLQTITDPSVYAGNVGLCGFPLWKCPGDEDSHNSTGSEARGASEGHIWLYASLAFGFVIGFWSFCGILVFSRSWRIKYFRLVDNMGEWLSGKYVSFVIKLKQIIY